MFSRIQSTVARRALSTSKRTRTALPSEFATSSSSSSSNTAPFVAATATAAAMTAAAQSASPRLGRVARWYLPAMAAVALGITYLPDSIFTDSNPRTVTLGEAHRRITYTVAAHLNQQNQRANANYEPTHEERQQMMLNSYGDRSSLDDMEKAIAGYEANFGVKSEVERRRAMEEAYGDRSSLKHLKRAMEIYEVQ